MAIQTYNFQETRNNWSGALDDTSSPNSMKTRARRSFFYSKITGTKATARLYQNGSNQNSGMIQVSIDGGQWEAAGDAVDNAYVLFSGLSDEPHDVFLRWHPAYGNSGTVPKGGDDWLSVEGNSPSALLMEGVESVAQLDILSTGSTENNSPGYLPENWAYDSRYPTRVCFISEASNFYVVKAGESSPIYVSVNGAPAFQVSDSGDINTRVSVFTGDGNRNSYHVWSHSSILSVGADSTLIKFGTRLDQFGDSISYGGGATNPRADTDVNFVAINFGMLGGVYAVSGWKVNDLLVNLPGILANTTVSEGDVAILAIGRNDVSTLVSDLTVRSEYNQIINLLINKGYSKILCRGIFGEVSSSYSEQNSVLESEVLSFSNPNIIWIDVSSWTSIERPDNVHPNATGYQEIAAYSIADYAEYLSPVASEMRIPKNLKSIDIKGYLLTDEQGQQMLADYSPEITGEMMTIRTQNLSSGKYRVELIENKINSVGGPVDAYLIGYIDI